MYSLFLSVSLFMTGMYIPSDWKDKSPRGSTASLPQPFLPFPPSLLYLPSPSSSFPSLLCTVLPLLFSLFSAPLLLFYPPSLCLVFPFSSSLLILPLPFSFTLSILPPMGNPEQSEFQLELEEKGRRKSNSSEIILSTEHVKDWRSQEGVEIDGVEVLQE